MENKRVHKTARAKKSSVKKSIYWPGTKIIKSHGNSFDWKSGESYITNTQDFKNINNAQKQLIGQTESRFNITYRKGK